MSKNFYSHKVNDSLWDNYYYIHKHQEHIGMMSKGENFTLEDEKIIQMFNQKKKAVKAIKQQYKDLFLRQIIDSQERELVSEVFRDNSVDKILKTINNSMSQELNRLINIELPNDLAKIKNETQWNTTSLQHLIDDIKTDKDLQALDNILTSLGDAVKLIDSKQGATIADLLINERKEGIGLSEYGKELWLALDKAEDTLDGKTIEGKQLLKAVGELKKIAKRFEYKTKGGTQHENESPLTGEIIKNYIDKHFFSTIMGELLAQSINMTALQESQKVFIEDPFKSIQGVGKNTYSIVQTNIKGEFEPNEFINKTLASGKTDVRFDNFQIDLAQELKQDNSTLITLGFGFSVKTYKLGVFNDDGAENNKKFKIESGDTLTLSDAINLITNVNYNKYIAYNIFAHEGEKGSLKNASKRLQNLQDSIFTRSLIYTFSSRGLANKDSPTDDFAMFILANGKLISIWDIIQYIENTNLGIRSIRDKYVSFGIEGITKLNVYFADTYNFKERTKGINNKITSAKISAHLDVLGFANYIANKAI